MNFLIKVIITAVAVFVADYFMDSVQLSPDLKTTIIVALVLAVLNSFVKPILVVLTIPITIITLGLFLLIINAIIVKLADYFITGFSVDGWISAILFSLIVSIVSYILNMFVDKD
jgi:putative membrane protein